MRKWSMTPQLFQTISQRLELMENEDKYMRSLLAETNTSTSASGLGMVGTQIPQIFGLADTFIANPQGVGIGILARMAETDPTVLSSIQLKSQMMLSKIGEYQHDDDEIEDFVRDFLAQMEGPTWQESLEAQTSYVPYGFSISEIGWGLSKTGQKIPTRVRTYHPSTICFEVDQFGDVTERGIIQFTQQYSQFSNPNRIRRAYGGEHNPFETPDDWLMPYRMPFIANYGLVRIPKSKVLHHVNSSMTSFGSPYGKAYVRTAHLAWQLKVFFMKQMGVAGKRNAQPFIWGTAPMQQNKVQFADPETGEVREMTPIQALTEMLGARETDDAIVTGPQDKGYTITPVANQADLNQYLAVLGWLDTQIFRGFMLPSLIMTEGNAGSRSLGDKHFQIVDRIAETEALKFTQTIIRQMIRPAIEMNFGEQSNYGHFAERPQSIEERERLSQMFSTLSSSGFMNTHNQVDGDFVRSALHLPNQDASFYAQGMPNFGPMGGGPAGLPKDEDDAPAGAPTADDKDAPQGDEAGEGGPSEDDTK